MPKSTLAHRTATVPAATSAATTAVLSALAAIPEEAVWAEGHRSPNTRRAYRADVTKFARFYGITSHDQFRQVDRAAVIAFQRHLETSGVQSATIARNLTALSSLFAHLVDQHILTTNPCANIKRPHRNERHGSTPAFSPAQARRVLDAPDPTTLQGVRDRAILSVGFQAGPRRASIVALRVRDFRPTTGYDSLRFRWKGGFVHVVALHPQTAQRIRDYLERAGHAHDLDGPLFRPVRLGPPRPGRAATTRRHLDPKMIDLLLKRYCRVARIRGRYSAHSMRATFITTTLANGCSLHDVQDAAGHADPKTTELYDRRAYSPERSATFFANY